MLSDKSRTAAAWLGLPAGLALSSTLGVVAGRLAAPAVWPALSKIPLLNPTPEAVAAGAIAITSTLAPLAMVPAIRLLQRAGGLPRWATAPVGLSVAIAGGAIPSLRHDPKFGWVYDAKIVSDSVAESVPLGGDMVAQEAEDSLAEGAIGRVTLVVCDGLVHRAP